MRPDRYAETTSHRGDNSRGEQRERKPSPQCARIQARLLSYSDGQATLREQVAVEEHLAACPLCREELAWLQQSEQALSGARALAPVPGDLRAGFYARLAASEPTQRKRVDWRLALPALAACGVFAGLLSVRNLPPTGLKGATGQTNPVIADLTQGPGTSPASGTILSRQAAADRSISTKPGSAGSDRIAGSDRKAATNLQPQGDARRVASLAPPDEDSRIFSSVSTPHAGKTGWKKTDEREGSRTVAPLPHSAFPQAVLQSTGVRVAGAGQAALQGRVRHHSGAQDPSRSIAAGPGTPSTNAPLLIASLKNSSSASFKRSKRVRSDSAPHNYDAFRPDSSNEMAKSQRKAALITATPASVANGTVASDIYTRSAAMESLAGASDSQDGIDFTIRDTRRGFVSGSHVASQLAERDGKQVLTIRIDDNDADSLSLQGDPNGAVEQEK